MIEGKYITKWRGTEIVKTIYGNKPKEDEDVYTVIIYRDEQENELNTDARHVAYSELDKFTTEYEYINPHLRMWKLR